jgi:hypothetical protein
MSKKKKIASGKARRRRRQRGSKLTNREEGIAMPLAFGSLARNRSPPLEHVRIRHREYVADVTQAAAGVTEKRQLPWNPGIKTSAPWLSSLAHAFEKYKIHSFAFEYIPQCGTSVAGMIAICPDYDALDQNLTNTKQELLSFADTARGPVWANIQCRLTSGRFAKRDPLYLRSGLHMGSNFDLKTYDAFSVTLVSNANLVGTVGELWINYDITLSVPQHSRDEVPGAYMGFGAWPSPLEPYAQPSTVVFNDAGFIVDPTIPGNANAHMRVDCEPGTYLVECDGTGVGITDVTDPVLENAIAGDTISVLRKIWNAAGTVFSIVYKLVKASTSVRATDLIMHWTGVIGASVAGSNLRITAASDEF